MEALNIANLNMQSSPNVNLDTNIGMKTDKDFMAMFDNVINKVNEKLGKVEMQKPADTNGIENEDVELPDDFEVVKEVETVDSEIPEEVEIPADEDEKEVTDEVAACVMSTVLNVLQETNNIEDFTQIDDEGQLVISEEKLPELTMKVKEELPKDIVIKADDVLSEEFNLDDIVKLATDFTLDEANVKIDEENLILKEEFDNRPIELDLEVENEPLEEVVDENGFLVNFEKVPELSNEEKMIVLKDTINEMIDKVEVVDDKVITLPIEKPKVEIEVVDEEIETIEKMPEKEIKIDTETEETIEEIVPEEKVVLEEKEPEADTKSDHKDSEKENKDVKRININEVMRHETIKPDDTFENEITKAEEIVSEARDLTDRFLENVNVVKQMVRNVELKVGETNSEMSIKLDPENLGKVNLKIVTDNGIVTAKFEAENQRVKEIIESNLSLLKESLENKGVQINGLEVSVGQNMSKQFNDNRQNIDYMRRVVSGKNPHKILGKNLNNSIFIADNNIRNVNRGLFMTRSKVNYIA